MNPLQAMIDGMSANMQKIRAQEQMTLGILIGALEKLPQERVVYGVGKPHSYRGYYDDLAFEPTATVQTVGTLLDICKKAMGRVFTGYKGGDFMMGENTPIWISEYGCCGQRLISLDVSGEQIKAMCAPEDE